MMGELPIKLYDKAMLARWQFYFKNTYWVNSEGDIDIEVRDQIIDTHPGIDQEDKSIYPYFALRRIGVPLAKPQNNNFSENQRGLRLHDQETYLTSSRFMLEYQLDIYSSDREIFDELVVEVQENFLRESYFSIDSEDRNIGELSMTLDLEDIIDLSSIESRGSTNLYRAAFRFTTMAVIVRRITHVRAENLEVQFVYKDNVTGEEGIITDVLTKS